MSVSRACGSGGQAPPHALPCSLGVQHGRACAQSTSTCRALGALCRDGESLDRALALNGTSLHGRKIKMGYAQPKKD